MNLIKKNLKKIGIACAMVILLLISFYKQDAKAQISTGQDMQQLLLDIEKLTQFKAILSDMQQGYSILTQGYGQVKDLSQGNFNLHSVFLNALLQVNPEIAKYARVADIIADEASILSEYKKAYKQFQNGGHFNADELDYLAKVYAHVLFHDI